MPALTVDAAGRRIDSGWLWRGVSFEVAAGERLGVRGPSGSGKSLLLRALSGLDPLDEGSVTFEGRTLTDWPLPAYRARVMLVPQQPALLEGTVEDNLRAAFALEAHRDHTYDAERLREALRALGRGEDFLARRVAVLSGGEQQIAAFLRAVQLDPRVLLLDEPTASLDPQAAAEVERLVDRWHAADPGRASIWTSHSAEQRGRVTTREISLGPPWALPSNDPE